MDKKQKALKEQFQYKLELAKRKKDFLKNLKDLKQAQKDIFNKKQEINEFIKQEKITYKNDIKNAVSDYKNEIKKQKDEIKKQKDEIKKDQIKFKEITNLELQKLDKEISNKKYHFQKKISDIKRQTNKIVLENKKLMQKIKQENKMELVKEKAKYDQKKLELAKSKIVHIENLANHKKELENIKRQQSYDKVDLYKKLRKIKNERMLERKKQKYELKMLVEKERQSFELDAAKIKNEQISYNNLLKIKNQEQQIKNEKIKFETEKLKQNQKWKEALEKQMQLKNNKIQNQFIIAKESNWEKSSIVDQKVLPLKIDLTNENIKGFVVSDVGKRAIKIFNKLNIVDTSNKLEKCKISTIDKNLIKKVRDLKEKNALVPINDYVKLATFLSGKTFQEEKVQAIIVSIIYNLIKGKTFSFLGGYFSLIKVKRCRKIVYSTTKSKLSNFSVFSLPDSNVTKILEKLLVEKLKYKPFIKITENIVITNFDNQLKVITDVGFMR